MSNKFDICHPHQHIAAELFDSPERFKRRINLSQLLILYLFMLSTELLEAIH